MYLSNLHGRSVCVRTRLKNLDILKWLHSTNFSWVWKFSCMHERLTSRTILLGTKVKWREYFCWESLLHHVGYKWRKTFHFIMISSLYVVFSVTEGMICQADIGSIIPLKKSWKSDNAGEADATFVSVGHSISLCVYAPLLFMLPCYPYTTLFLEITVKRYQSNCSAIMSYVFWC